MENNELNDLDLENNPLLRDNTDQDFEDSVLDNEIDITDMEETSFINPNFEDLDTALENIKRPENQSTKAVENFIRRTNPNFRFKNTDREIQFRLHIGSTDKNNNITYRPLLENNERGKPQIVLKRNKDILVYNDKVKSKYIQEAIKQFKEEIDLIVNEEKEDEFYDRDNYSFVDTTADMSHITGLSPQENRELQGVLYPTETTSNRLGDEGSLQKQANHFQELLNETIDERNKTDNPEEFIELEERVLCLREAVNRTISQRSNEKTKNNQILDLKRLEKFKKWSKDNLVALSGVAIAIGGIITSIIIGGRTVIQRGSQATFSFGKILAKIAKELGPIGSTILNLVGTFLKLGAKGISFLANNLWILVLAITWFIYDFLKNKKKKKLLNK